MTRTRLELPETFPFVTDIPVRITDVNYAGHLGNDALLGILHEARLQYLKTLGFSEMDAGGVGIIMLDAVIVYRAEGFYGDVLQVSVATTDLQETGCDFVYRVLRKTTGTEVARAKTAVAFFDYGRRRVARTPLAFRQRVEAGTGSSRG